MMFVLPTISSLYYLLDRLQGMIDRDSVAGIKGYHYIIAVLLSDSVTILVQIALFFGIYSYLYDMNMQGSWPLAVSLAYINSITGLAAGKWLSGSI